MKKERMDPEFEGNEASGSPDEIRRDRIESKEEELQNTIDALLRTRRDLWIAAVSGLFALGIGGFWGIPAAIGNHVETVISEDKDRVVSTKLSQAVQDYVEEKSGSNLVEVLSKATGDAVLNAQITESAARRATEAIEESAALVERVSTIESRLPSLTTAADIESLIAPDRDRLRELEEAEYTQLVIVVPSETLTINTPARVDDDERALYREEFKKDSSAIILPENTLSVLPILTGWKLVYFDGDHHLEAASVSLTAKISDSQRTATVTGRAQIFDNSGKRWTGELRYSLIALVGVGNGL